MPDPLFPPVPEELSDLSDERLEELVNEHVEAQRLVRANDADFIGDLTAPQIIEQLRSGRDQLAALRAEQELRGEAIENYEATVAELTPDVENSTTLEADEDDGDDDGDEGGDAEPEAALEAEAETLEPDTDEAEAVEPVEEPVLAAAKPLRKPPAPSKDRTGGPVVEDTQGAAVITAAGNDGIRAGEALDRDGFSKVVIEKARRLGKPTKHLNGTEERYLLASGAFKFPEDRILRSNELDANAAKVRALRNTDGDVLVASGGLCAPLTPIYSIPNFAVRDRPVRGGLPSFQADRGGVNVPTPDTIGDITTAITVIEEADDALGGTFATKSCQAQDCLPFAETAVTIISHCREYGNLNARAWPESVAHENELTMAAHARTAETYLLDRIKAQSIQLTTASVYSTVHDLLYAATRAGSGIRNRLRATENIRLRALLPEWVPDMMLADIAATQFDRFKSRAQCVSILRGGGIEPVFYKDSPSTGTTQNFADEVTLTTLDDFPDVIQWALYVEGAFLHLDGGTLELGVVRDSTLNSTNDFQVFGETFENVARVGPEQAALWLTSTVCPSGEFPALATALSC